MNLLDLFVRIGAKDEASEKVSSVSSKIKSGLGTAAKAGVAAVSAAAVAVSALVTQSVNAYADYEQLVGGVETLFGAGGASLEEYAASVGKTVAEVSEEYDSLMAAQDTVLANAANAYQTAGMSANDYMETVTSFSASLISSLGGDTEAAAAYADMAITDMSDNANKMGTDIESIQNAYQGFAKQNYTMLDNLKLGYGGTSSEMERLIEDAEELDSTFVAARDENGDLAMSYSDIVDAIHIVQDNMGITGTTAKEASSTIQGSVSSMKAAWTNLVTGMADDEADFEGLIDNFVASVDTVGGNIIPRIEIALQGVSTLISELVPVIIEEIPPIIEQNLPTLLSAGVDIIMALIDGIVEAAPTIITTLLDSLGDLGSKLAPIFPDLIDVGMDLIDQILEGLVDSLPEILQALIDLTVQVAEALTDPTTLASIIESVFIALEEIVAALIANLPMILEAISQIVSNIGVALLLALENLGVIEWWTNAWNSFVTWITELWNSISDFFSEVWENIKATFSEVVDAIGGFFSDAWDAVVAVWDAVAGYFIGVWESIKETFSVVVETLSGFFSDAWNAIVEVWNVVIEFFSGIWDGIKNVFSTVESTIGGWFSSAWDTISLVWSVVVSFFSGIWDSIKETFSSVSGTLGGFFSDAWTAIKDKFSNWSTFFSNLWTKVKNAFSNAKTEMGNIGKNIVDGVWNGITNAWNTFKTKVTNKFTNLVNSVKSALGIASPSKVFAQIGGFMAEGLGEGWEDEFSDVQKSLNNDLDFSANVSGASGAVSSGYGNTITINVNGANYSNEQSLAKAISYQLEMMLDTRRAAYA